MTAQESAVALRSMYSEPSVHGGRRTMRLREQQWLTAPGPPPRPSDGLHYHPVPPPTGAALTEFKPRRPGSSTVKLMTQVDDCLRRSRRQVDRLAGAETWPFVPEGEGPPTHRVLSAAVAGSARNPYASLPWSEARQLSARQGKEEEQAGPVGGLERSAISPADDALVEALRPDNWGKRWPAHEANRPLIARLAARAAEQQGHVGREAALRNGAVSIGRCSKVVLGGEQAAVELKLNLVGEFLADEIDSVLMVRRRLCRAGMLVGRCVHCLVALLRQEFRLAEQRVVERRRRALAQAKRDATRLPRLRKAAGLMGGPPAAMSQVFAKGNRIIRMPRVGSPAEPIDARVTMSARSSRGERPGQHTAQRWSARTSTRSGALSPRSSRGSLTRESWLQAKLDEEPYRTKQIRRFRKERRLLREDERTKKLGLEKRARKLMKDMDFLLERKIASLNR